MSKGIVIKSGGTPNTTKVMYNGEELPGVVSITIDEIRYDSGQLKATIEIYVEGVDIDIPEFEVENRSIIKDLFDRDVINLAIKGAANE